MSMDIPVEKEIENTKRRLALLETRDPEVAFKCPKCGKYFSQLGNYRTLGMCGSCFTKTKTKEMKDRVRHLLGGKIVDIKLEKADPLLENLAPIITQIIVETADGQRVPLNKEKEIHYLL